MMKFSDMEKIDTKSMFRVYDDWPEIARNAYETDFEKVDIQDIDHVVFVGMGGSGSIGDTIGSILSKEDIHVSIVKGYQLPKTVDSKTMIIATSVSGNTAETLSILENLKKTQSKVIGFSSGGKMEKLCNENNFLFKKIPMVHSPRASFPTFLYSILNILETIIPIKQKEIYESISELNRTQKNIFSQNLIEENRSLQLAEFITEIVCIYYPAGLKAAAIRYKNCLQENSKIHAMTEDVIESCHNGVVSWERDSIIKPVFIRGVDDHPKTRERWSILKEFFDSKSIDYRIIESVEGSILTKITNLIYLLDYSSIYTAILNKIDPSPVESIDFVKKRL